MPPPLFHRVLGEALDHVPEPIVALHDIGAGMTWSGRARVTTGSSLFARLIGTVMNFPPSSDSIPISVEMTPNGAGEIWVRRFGDHELTSDIQPGPAPKTIIERLGPASVTLRLMTDGQCLRHLIEDMRLFGIQLPRSLWPTAENIESAEGGQYRFEIDMAVLGIQVLRYDGYLETGTSHGL